LKQEFVLVDFENVQPNNLEHLGGRPVKIKIFLGIKQAKIPLAMAQAMQAFGPDAEYIQIDGNGSNALDFHIAYYIGQLAAENPGSSFHIVSNDTGFDPLIRHLRTKGISCQRTKSLSEIGALKIPKSSSNAQKVDALIDNLAKRKAARPRTLKTLRGTIKALFVNQLSAQEIDDLVGELTACGTVTVSDGKVHYELPS
jgi:PIN domain-containing protein